MTKILILGTSYVGPGAQGYGDRLVTLWARLALHLNPGIHVTLIDSASPTAPAEFLRPLGFKAMTITEDSAFRMDLTAPGTVLTWTDNVGHLNSTGVDGWGRSFCKGIDVAISHGFDYLAYMDADIICTDPVRPIIAKMKASGVKAACPMDTSYNFIENGLMFLDVRYLKASKFVARYDWRSRSGRTQTPQNIPEYEFEKLLGDALFTLPMRGIRNDFNRITVNNLEHAFPYGGCSFLTHCGDFAVYQRLLELKGIAL